MYDGIVQELIDELGRLPGIGPKSAQRIAFHILQTESFDVTRLSSVLIEVRHDLIATRAGVRDWGDRLARCLTQAMAGVA